MHSVNAIRVSWLCWDEQGFLEGCPKSIKETRRNSFSLLCPLLAEINRNPAYKAAHHIALLSPVSLLDCLFPSSSLIPLSNHLSLSFRPSSYKSVVHVQLPAVCRLPPQHHWIECKMLELRHNSLWHRGYQTHLEDKNSQGKWLNKRTWLLRNSFSASKSNLPRNSERRQFLQNAIILALALWPEW